MRLRSSWTPWCATASTMRRAGSRLSHGLVQEACFRPSPSLPRLVAGVAADRDHVDLGSRYRRVRPAAHRRAGESPGSSSATPSAPARFRPQGGDDELTVRAAVRGADSQLRACHLDRWGLAPGAGPSVRLRLALYFFPARGSEPRCRRTAGRRARTGTPGRASTRRAAQREASRRPRDATARRGRSRLPAA